MLEYWNNWANEWNLGGPEYVVSRTGFRGEERMATECTMGNWAVPGLEAEDSFAPNYAIYPQLRFADAVNPNGFANYGFYWMVNANASEAEQEAAWKLIAWLSSRPDRYLNEAGLFQPKAAYLESEEFKNNEIMPVFLDEIASSYFHPRFAGFNEVIDAIMRMRIASSSPVKISIPCWRRPTTKSTQSCSGLRPNSKSPASSNRESPALA